MRRVAVVLLIVLGVGATAVAQDRDSPATEPDLRSRDVFRMTGACAPGDRVTVRIDPSGALLASVRIHVAGREVVRLTGVQGPASATVRIRTDRDTRVTATGDSIGGQALYRTRIYGRCGPGTFRDHVPVIGGGED